MATVTGSQPGWQQHHQAARGTLSNNTNVSVQQRDDDEIVSGVVCFPKIMFTSVFVARFSFCHVLQSVCACVDTELDYESCSHQDVGFSRCRSVATRRRTCSVCVQMMFLEFSFLFTSSGASAVRRSSRDCMHTKLKESSQNLDLRSESETGGSAQQLSTRQSGKTLRG